MHEAVFSADRTSGTKSLGKPGRRGDLPAVHGRGIDHLPSGVTVQFEDSLVRRLDTTELSRAFRVVVGGLVSEIRSMDEELAGRLREALTSLSESPR
jgi:hypothetical protein